MTISQFLIAHLQQYQATHNVSDRALSCRVGGDPGLVRRLKVGKSSIRLSTADALAKETGLNVELAKVAE